MPMRCDPRDDLDPGLAIARGHDPAVLNARDGGIRRLIPRGVRHVFPGASASSSRRQAVAIDIGRVVQDDLGRFHASRSGPA